MKTPIQELQEKLDNLAIELSSTREKFASTKKKVRNLHELLIGSGPNRTATEGEQKLPDDGNRVDKSWTVREIGFPNRIDTGAKDHAGKSIYIGDTVTLLTRSKATKFKLKWLFKKGDKVIVHRFASGFLYVRSAENPREETTRLPTNVIKE